MQEHMTNLNVFYQPDHIAWFKNRNTEVLFRAAERPAARPLGGKKGSTCGSEKAGMNQSFPGYRTATELRDFLGIFRY